jgi:uncharacterized protein
MAKFGIRGTGILVTGASTGIGREIALELGRRGARLALAARSEDRLNELAERIAQDGERPVVLATDLSDTRAAAALAGRAIAALGQVDVLVNNAGLGIGGLQLNAADGDAARDLFQVNYWSPLALQRELVPSMIDRGFGAVVNVTSLVTVSPWPALGHYSSTKAALSSATETLRLELTHTGVHVLEVIPGPVETALQAESRLLPGFRNATRMMPQGDPVILARRVAEALERRRARVVYPRRLRPSYVLPGLMRFLLPHAVARYLSRDELNPTLQTRVLRAGSRGDAESLDARRDWEVGSSRVRTAG